MAGQSDAAKARIFGNVYICMKCNARNRVAKPEKASCRKCGYSGLRKKHSDMRA